MNENLKLLDCTFRDGGHLNQWNFDYDCVQKAYKSASVSGVDYFEIGYRTPASIKNLGQFAYCTDDFLLNLIEPIDTCKLTIMIDVGKSEVLIQECMKEVTPVKAIRIASYPYELDKAIELVEIVKDKGYEVFLNLMAFSEFTIENFQTLMDWKNKDMLNAIYFADSFGSFLPNDVSKKLKLLKDCGFERIGFHAHNNLQLAFANTLILLDNDIEYVDASIYGMGRGSGNLQMEVLLAYLEKTGKDKYNPLQYLKLVDTYFIDLYKDYNWGYNLQSLMGGIKNIHPYYIHHLYKKGLSIQSMWNCLDDIKRDCPISFSAEKLNEILEQRTLLEEKDNILEYLNKKI